LSREPEALGAALAVELEREGIEVLVAARPAEARRDGEDFVVALVDGRELRGDRLLAATGRRPRIDGLGWRPCRSRRALMVFPWTTTFASPTGCGRSATSPDCGR
jgi:hypothetical protein